MIESVTLRTGSILFFQLSEFINFNEGNPVKVNVPVQDDDRYLYQRGEHVQIRFKEKRVKGKIISNPITIYPARQDEPKALSIIIEKS